ncbi:MAG: hypothetical protein KFW07_03825 [Mycoplasmataceae bacterium]|nr:hypothetical protein [Mycoplasmataceae bacterium]
MILKYNKVKTFLEKVDIDTKKFIDSSEEYVFQEKGKKSKYIVEDNFKVLTYDILDTKSEISIKGKVKFFEPNIFILTKGSEYSNKQFANQNAFGKFNIDLRLEVSENKWSIDKGDYSESSVNICFYAPSGVYSFITGLSSGYYKGDFLGIDGKKLKTKLKRRDINSEISSDEGILDMFSKILKEKLLLATREEKIKLIKVDGLLKICRPSNFRKMIVKVAEGKSEIESKLSFKNELSLLEAAHIISVESIVEYAKKELKKTNNISEEVIENIRFLTSSANGMLIPFNYHKLFDKKIIKFDISKRKFLATNIEAAELIESYGITNDHKLSNKCFERVEKTFKLLSKY